MLLPGDNDRNVSHRNERVHTKAHKYPNAMDGIILVHLTNQLGPHSLPSVLEESFQGKCHVLTMLLRNMLCMYTEIKVHVNCILSNMQKYTHICSLTIIQIPSKLYVRIWPCGQISCCVKVFFHILVFCK